MLLTESRFDGIDHETDPEKNLYLKGVFMESEKKNGNGRIYPYSEMVREVNRFKERLGQGEQILGHLDHPDTFDILLRDTSHNISTLEMQGNDVVGKLCVLPTPMGNIARSLVESGIHIGLSSRASGQVDSKGYVYDFNLITIDLVATPSAKGAVPQSLWEAVQNHKNASNLSDLAHAIRYDARAQDYFKKEINSFIEGLFESKQ